MSCPKYTNRCWYAYIQGDPLLASSYTKSSIVPSCLTGCNICAIYVPACAITPRSPLSANMRRYIADALITCLPQPQPFNCKYFVYMKTL